MSYFSAQERQESVRDNYAFVAQIALDGGTASCCGGAAANTAVNCCGDGGKDVIVADLYSVDEQSELPAAALLASMGCGNPTALAELQSGETVLDLGSGGGVDVLLSARRVGPTGFVYGLDMTDEMLALAETNRATVGAENVQFLRGHIESIPLPDASVDVVLSNCVVNLSNDKRAVFSEAFRVLKPGGRLAISDVLVEGDLPTAVREDMTAWVGCVAGAMERVECLNLLQHVGFENASIEPTRMYRFADLQASACASPTIDALSAEEKTSLDGRIFSAFIRAIKPA